MRLFFYTFALALCVTSAALAHEGHADAPGSESASGATTGPIEVSEVALRDFGDLDGSGDRIRRGLGAGGRRVVLALVSEHRTH